MTLEKIPPVASDPDSLFDLAAASPLRIVVNHKDEGVRIVIAGELDLSTTPFLRAKLSEELAILDGELVLDLGLLTFMGSTGLSLLLALRKNLSSRGLSLKILNPSPRVVRVLQLTGLKEFFSIEPPI